MKSRIVAYRNLRHSKSSDVEFPSHFHADYAAFRFECDLFKYLAAEDPEVTIHVANGQLKGKSHASPVQFANDDAIPRIRTLYFVAINQIDVRTKLGEKIMNLANIVLSVTVGIEDEILSGAGESRNQCRAISPIGFMVDDSQEWQFLSEVFQYFPGIVFAPVVDNNHFEIVGYLANF
jgi:hypothetical protein